MQDFNDPVARQFVRQIHKSDLTIEFKNGSRISLFGAEAADRIRGHGFDAFVTDEAADLRYGADYHDIILGPALADRRGSHIQIGTPSGRGKFYSEFRKGDSSAPDAERDVDYDTIQVTAVEAGIIDRAEIERARRTRSKRAFQQEYEASFVAPIGIVFPEWDEKVHVVDEVPKRFDEVIVGVDWGTAARGAFVVLGVDRFIRPRTDKLEAGEVQRVHVIREESHQGVGYDEGGWWRLAREIQEKHKPDRWYADPAGGSEGYLRQLREALAQLRDDRLTTTVVPANNQVNPGIAAVSDFLRVDEVLEEPQRFFVHSSCKWLRAEFANYRWKAHQTVEEAFIDKPVKEDDHCLDALRYAIMTHFYSTGGRRHEW